MSNAAATLSAQPAVHFVNPLEVPDWDQRLAAMPGATFFHSVAWSRVLLDAYGYQPLWAGREESGRHVALIPLMQVDSWLTGRRGVGLPFTDESPPLVTDAGVFRELWEAVRQEGLTRRWKHVELRGGRGFAPDAPASTRFFNHTLRLPRDEKQLLGSFEDSVRRAIRKAEKSGLQVEFLRSDGAMREFHALMRLTRQRHGVPPQPWSFFSLVQRHVLEAGHGWIVLARHEGRAVAGAVYFHFGSGAIYKYGASDERLQHLRANNLVMWSAIRRYAGEGYTSLDFGRTSLDNEGLRRFKLGWGTEERTVEYLRLNLRTGCYVTAQDEASGWHTKVFQRLPLVVSGLVGRMLYRHMG